MHRDDHNTSYVHEAGKSCPAEILEALAAFNAEGRPVWKPMHLQPYFAENDFITAKKKNAENEPTDVGSDVFERGLCLPSDNKMTKEQQDVVIEIIHRCFI